MLQRLVIGAATAAAVVLLQRLADGASRWALNKWGDDTVSSRPSAHSSWQDF